jgi:hypothetical protein
MPANWGVSPLFQVDYDKVTRIAAVPGGSEPQLEGVRTGQHAKPLERLLPRLPLTFLRCQRT